MRTKVIMALLGGAAFILEPTGAFAQDATPAPAPAPAPRASHVRGGALPLETPAPEAEAGEDLEIPSFLRRLAN